MAKQVINIGTSANSKDGDIIRDAFRKVNENFDELYTGAGGGTASFPDQTGNENKFLTTNGTVVSWVTVPQGPQGNQGVAGPAGPAGSQGPQGEQGQKGDVGPRGFPGLPGKDGEQGPQGVQGVRGATGAQGIQGETGPHGPTGSQGAQGNQGEQGPKGDSGPRGFPGLQGERGLQGDKGDKGDTGAQGTSVSLLGTVALIADLGNIVNPQVGDAWVVTESNGGDLYFRTIAGTWENIGRIVGPQGNTGPQGLKGDTGAQGIPGLQGPAGADGAEGAQGIQGIPGVDGADGAQGPQGIPGNDGPQGIQGIQGLKGDKGDQGIQGIQGIQGDPGLDADTGNFLFNADTASLPLGNTMLLRTYQNGGNRESKLTLAPTGDSALDVGGGLRVRTAFGTGFEESWTFNTDGSITWPDASKQTTAFAGTGDITFFGNEIRSVNSHVKLVANSDSVDRRVLQLYTDGTVEIPVGITGAGLVQSPAGLWLSANGSQLKLNPNGAVDLPLVNGTTGLIRTAGHNTINSNGKEWLFNSNGNLQLPTAGDIIDSTGASVLTPSSVVNGLFNITLNATGDFIPSTDILQDLGSTSRRFRHLYVGPGSVYIGSNVITESATGSLVLPGLTKATGYYAEEVDDEDDWGSNPTITGTVTVIDAQRYEILAGRPASANYAPATYIAQKDGNKVDEITVDETGGGWTQTEAYYARDNNMYATNVAGAINNFNAGDWVQIPFRVEVKAEDTEYEDIFGAGGAITVVTPDDETINDITTLVFTGTGVTTSSAGNAVTIDITGSGSADLGNFTIDGSTLEAAAMTVKTNDGDINIESDSNVYVKVAGGTKYWSFATDGNLTLPEGGDIRDSNGSSVLGGGGPVDLSDYQAGSDPIRLETNQSLVMLVDGQTGIDAASDELRLYANNHYLTINNAGLLELDPAGIKFSDGTTQTTAYTSGTNANTGNVVFDGNQIYVGGVGFLNLDNNDRAVIGTNGTYPLIVSLNEDDKQWEFNPTGDFYMPDGGAIRFNYGYIDQDPDRDTDALRISGGNGVTIKADEDGKTWRFNNDGSITFPDSTVQTTAYTGQSGGSSTVARQDTAPSASNGTLWFNTVEGRLYIKYNNAWVDAAPLMMPAPDTDLDVNSITFPDASILTSAYINKLVNGVHEVTLASNGTLRLADDLILPRGSRWIKDCEGDGGTTSMRWYNVPTDTQEVELLRVYSGEAPNVDNTERATISLEWQATDVSGLSITAFDRTDGTDEHKWEFRGNGNLTLPGNITFLDNTVQTTAYTGGVIIPAASNLVFALGTDFTGTIIGDYGNGSGYIRVESNTGAPNFSPAPISTEFYNFLSTITAGTEFTVNTVVDGTTYNTVVSFTQFAGGGPVDTDRNDLYYTFVSGDTLPFSYAATALTLTFEGSAFSFTTSAVTFPDGTIQTTAYPGITTVAKTGVDINANNVLFEVTAVDEFGVVTELTVTNSPNPAWVSPTGGVGLGDVNYTVNFDGAGNASVTINSSGTGHSLGQTFNIPATAVGATAPTPTAIDLTKSINKLADGAYSLADGVEGQIMYLVRQTGSSKDAIRVNVANARIDGVLDTTINYYPFENVPDVNMSTLIFTDGAWQASNGGWD